MDISVIIPTFNRREVLCRTLSLYGHQHGMRGRFEVLVCDDGSTDGTPQMLESLRDKLGFPLRWFVLNGNAGPSTARNRAIAAASGRVLLIVGDDILPDRQLLLEHWNWHTERHPEMHVGVLGQIRWADELSPTPFMHWLEQSGTQFGYARIQHAEQVDYGFLNTANISVKRELLTSTGEFFDERLRMFEDSEWGERLERKGFELRYNAHALGLHVHETTLDSSLRRMDVAGAAVLALRGVSRRNYDRLTHGLFEPANRTRLRLLRLVLHPAMRRAIYVPLARLCERHVIVDRVYAACHASSFLEGMLKTHGTGARVRPQDAAAQRRP